MVPQDLRVREVWSNDVRGISLEEVRYRPRVLNEWVGVKCFLGGVEAATLPSQLLVCSRCHSTALPSTLPRAEWQLRWHWDLWWNFPLPTQPSCHSLIHALPGFLIALFFSTNVFGFLWPWERNPPFLSLKGLGQRQRCSSSGIDCA